MPDLATLSATTAYALLFGLVFAESGVLLGFFLPGDTVLFAAGLLSGPGRALSLAVLLPVVLVAAITGDAVGYATGRRAGPALFDRGGRVLNSETLVRARAFYDRFGSFAVIAARWVPWVRTLTPLMAGAAGMPFARFQAANVVGAVTWGGTLLVLGHAAARTPGLRSTASYVAVGVVVGSCALAVRQARRSRR